MNERKDDPNISKLNGELLKAENKSGSTSTNKNRPWNWDLSSEPQEDTNKPKPVTQLLEKNCAPMIIRKYQSFGWPLFVAVICDQDLSRLDDAVMYFVKKHNPKNMNGIQDIRDFCGGLSNYVLREYNDVKFGSVEGLAIIAYWDKCVCSSLYGDFMTHTSCRIELFSLLNMLPHL